MAEEYVMLRGKTQDLLKDYGNVLHDLLNAPPGQTPTHGQQLVDESLSAFLASYYGIQSRFNDHALSVGLLALTKSGKSTFLNVLLGVDCMPTGTVPETARICRIVHNPTLLEPQMWDGTRLIDGTAAVRNQLHSLNVEVRQRCHTIFDEDILTISAPLAALAGQPVLPTELHLLDTPGPNEAGEEGLRFQVERLMDGIGVLVYLLDCTKLKTTEEREMFKRLQEINPQLLQRLSTRLFFLVNKKDAMSDMTDEEVQQYVADLVTSQMESQEFQLAPSQVLLMSAKTALYSRMIMSGVATDDQREIFAKMAFGQCGWQTASPEDCRRVAPGLFESSGIREVEQRLLGFLYAHAGRLQMLGTLDDMRRHLSQVENTVLASEAALGRDYEELSTMVADMRSQMDRVQKRFAEVKMRTNEVEVEVIDEIKYRMQRLKEKLFEQVEAVLSETQSPNLKNGWRKLWAVVRELLPPHVDSCAQFRVNDAQNRLTDLYLSISRQVEEEVRAFWHSLEVATNTRQQHLFGIINGKLQELAAEVEGVVSERLEVELRPANISMQPPSHAEHHLDLQELFSQGIHTEEVTHQVTAQVVDTVIERRYHVPLCKMGEYYVACPVTRSEIREIKETRVHLDPEKIKAFLMQEVEGMVNKSIHSVRSFVQEYMCKQLDGAKWRLAEYCNSYDAKMSAAMDVGMRDGEERQHALRQASKQAAAIKDIGMRLEALAEEVCGADTDEEGDCSPEESGCSVAASWVMESIPDGHKDAPMEANEVQDSVVHEVPPRENQLEPKANPEGTEETVEPAAVDADVTPKGEERADGRLGEESFMSATEELPAFECLHNKSLAETGDPVVGPFPQPDAPGQVSSDLIPWESIHGAHAPETAGQGDVDDGSADAAEIKYPAVEAFAPPSRGIVYPEVKPVMVGAEEQHDDEGASPAQIGIQMERLPVSRSASMMTSASYMASSSGPFNYEEGFQEAMTIRENEGQTEDGFVVV